MDCVAWRPHGFTSIPRSVSWPIVTLTTVGYGDIAPETVPGKALASLPMILGYGVLAVPTGIVGAERVATAGLDPRACPSSGADGHRSDAISCRRCATSLGPAPFAVRAPSGALLALR